MTNSTMNPIAEIQTVITEYLRLAPTDFRDDLDELTDRLFARFTKRDLAFAVAHLSCPSAVRAERYSARRNGLSSRSSESRERIESNAGSLRERLLGLREFANDRWLRVGEMTPDDLIDAASHRRRTGEGLIELADRQEKLAKKMKRNRWGSVAEAKTEDITAVWA